MAVRVTGNRDNPVYLGYTCVKGRSQPQFLASPDRLRHALKRGDDGGFTRIPLSQALDEVSAKLAEIIARDGARAVAGNALMMAALRPQFTSIPRGRNDSMRGFRLLCAATITCTTPRATSKARYEKSRLKAYGNQAMLHTASSISC